VPRTDDKLLAIVGDLAHKIKPEPNSAFSMAPSNPIPIYKSQARNFGEFHDCCRPPYGLIIKLRDEALLKF
jgi:hypothetical protein